MELRQDAMGMMMPRQPEDPSDPKIALWQFCQRFCKRNIAKTDIQYNSSKVHPNGTQATVKLLCLQSQEFAGEICSNVKDAEKSAAQQALQFYGAEAAATQMPQMRPQAAPPPHQMSAMPGGMGGMSAQQLLAMSGMPGAGMPGQGRPASIPMSLQGGLGQGGFGQPFPYMGGGGGGGGGMPAMGGGFGGGNPGAGYNMPPASGGMGGSPSMPQQNRPPRAQDQQRDNKGGGKGAGGKRSNNKGDSAGKGGGRGGQDGMRPGGGKGANAGGGGPNARQALGAGGGGGRPGGAAPQGGAGAPAQAGAGPQAPKPADGESMETCKSALNVVCMKLLKRPMQKGEIVYDSPQIPGGFQSILRLPCLPDMWAKKQWMGKVCMSRKGAEQDAAEKALTDIKSAEEFKTLLSEAATPKPAGKKKSADGEDKEGKGKGKGKGKFAWMEWAFGPMGGKGGPELERESVGEATVQGEVIEWKGNFGWIKPSSAIEHEAASRRGGKVYVHKKDLQGGAETLAVGASVNFKVYSDTSGLGASDVVVA